jgi:hypothetical protein
MIDFHKGELSLKQKPLTGRYYMRQFVAEAFSTDQLLSTDGARKLLLPTLSNGEQSTNLTLFKVAIWHNCNM